MDQQVASLSSLAEAALDELGLAVLVVGRRLELLHVNAAGRRLLELDDPLHLEHACVRSRISDLQKRLALAVESAASAGTPASIGLRAQAYVGMHMIRIAPLGAHRPAPVGLYIASTPTHLPSRTAVQELFDVSRAEAEVATLTADGFQPRVIAEIRKVSEGTVKTQMRHVFAKTGSANKTDLVRLLAAIPLLDSEH